MQASMWKLLRDEGVEYVSIQWTKEDVCTALEDDYYYCACPESATTVDGLILVSVSETYFFADRKCDR